MGSRLANKLFFVSVWGNDISSINKYSFLKKLLIKRVFKKSNQIFCTSKYLKTQAMKFTTKHIIQIPFGVDTEQFFPKKNYNKKEIIIGSTKNFEKKYGLKYLIKAFSKLSENYSNIKLFLIGKGSEKEYYNQLIKKYNIVKKTNIINHVAHDKLPSLLKDIDIFVMPSIFEEFGVAALEASSMGIPVIASDCGGIKEVVINNKSGFLVSPEDVNPIIKSLSKLIDSQQLREEMGQYGREFVLKNYKWKKNVDLKKSIYIKHYKDYFNGSN